MTADAKLVERLLAHADAHANVNPYDDEQAQWERDLREAAAVLSEAQSELAALREVGQRVVGAFRALGNAGNVITEFKSRKECEAAMSALDAALPTPPAGGEEG